MPVNMTVEEPRARIVGDKSECDIVCRGSAYIHDIAPGYSSDDAVFTREKGNRPWRINIVVISLACAPHDIEVVTVQVERMLNKCQIGKKSHLYESTPTGKPPPGIEISIVLLAGRP